METPCSPLSCSIYDVHMSDAKSENLQAPHPKQSHIIFSSFYTLNLFKIREPAGTAPQTIPLLFSSFNTLNIYVYIHIFYFKVIKRSYFTFRKTVPELH